jgi:hypothetical protein
MKKIILISAVFILIGVINTFACNISVDMDKDEYQKDEYAVITVVLSQDHRNCLHEGEEPLIKVSGLELVGKTDFLEIKDGVWQIKYKAKIINDSPVFIAERVCEKGGDQEKISINVA